MIEHHDGSLFDTSCQIIGHGVNTCGVMGAGIAKVFSDTFPGLEDAYHTACKAGRLLPGEVFFWSVPYHFDYPISGFECVVNLATQQLPGPDAKPEWVRSSLRECFRTMEYVGESLIALPRIASGIGGLQWEDVSEIITEESDRFDITVEVWTP